jgi:hypothetical protein
MAEWYAVAVKTASAEARASAVRPGRAAPVGTTAPTKLATRAERAVAASSAD